MIYLVGGGVGMKQALAQMGVTIQATEAIPDDLTAQDSLIVLVEGPEDIRSMFGVVCDRKIALIRENAVKKEDLPSLGAAMRLQNIEGYYPYHPTDLAHLFERQRHFMEIGEVVDRNPIPAVRVDQKEIRLSLPRVRMGFGRRSDAMAEPLILPHGFISFSGPNFEETQEVVQKIAHTLAAHGVSVTVAVATLWDVESDGVTLEDWKGGDYAETTDEQGVKWHFPGTPMAQGSEGMEVQENETSPWLEQIINSGGQVYLAVCGNPFTDQLSRAAWESSKKHVWVALSRYGAGVLTGWDRVHMRLNSDSPLVFVRDQPFAGAKTFHWKQKWNFNDSLQFLRAL